MEKVKTVLLVILSIALCVVMCFGFNMNRTSNTEYDALLGEYENKIEEVNVVRNENDSLWGTMDDILASSEEEKNRLLSLIADLEDKPAEIRYITKVVTQSQPSTPVYRAHLGHESYSFTHDNGLIVATYHRVNREQIFTTHSLKYRTTVVTGETSTSVLTEVSSSAVPGLWVPTNSTVDVTEIQDSEHQILEPHIGIGLTGIAPNLNVIPTLTLGFVHPTENVDILNLRFGKTKDAVVFGLDPLSWNAGSKLPVFTDLWVSAGVAVDTKSQAHGTVSLGTKF